MQTQRRPRDDGGGDWNDESPANEHQEFPAGTRS